MNFFKKLFSGGGGGHDKHTMIVYVQPKMCQEILQIRVDLYNSLSQTEEGYYLRKLARATRCPFEVEMEFYFNDERTLVNKTINNGEFVDEASYQAYIAGQA